jgi:hypothetical protein
MKKTVRNLTLCRETLRLLDESKLKEAAAGSADPITTQPAGTRDC